MSEKGRITMAGKKGVLLITGGLAVLLGLSLPVSNLFSTREPLAKGEEQEFRAVSNTLLAKCADCHTPGLTQYPVYFDFPIAHDIISKDIEHAQSAFLLTKEQLSGEEKISAAGLAKLKEVLENGSMPPFRYLALHWNAALSSSEKESLLSYIGKRAGEFEIRAIPSENPFNVDLKKAALGEKLYFDKRLSGDNTISCASCHAMDKGGCDQEMVSTGIKGQKGPINAPTVFNAAYNFAQFWDGRAKDLKEQAAGPVNNPKEMGSNWEQVLGKLKDDAQYKSQFKELYPEGMNADSITDAIATYEHTLLTPNSRFDKFLAGDREALTVDEKAGFELFKSHDCSSCHAGTALGGLSYEKMGARRDYFKDRGNLSEADNGRFNVTKNPVDKYRFKVPLLRNIELTYPYFHDASAKTLDEAVKVMAEYQTEKPMSEEERAKIVAFLKTLTGELNGKSLAKK